MKETNFGSNYLNEIRELLSHINGGMVNTRSFHPDIVILNGSPEYRRKTIGPNTFTQKVSRKLKNLIQRFNKGHTKHSTAFREPIPAI